MLRPPLLTCWLAGLCLALGVGARGAQDGSERGVFPLEETSGLDDRGHSCVCSERRTRTRRIRRFPRASRSMA
jgi:hypothetical protein